jgi:hypothetical protein
MMDWATLAKQARRNSFHVAWGMLVLAALHAGGWWQRIGAFALAAHLLWTVGAHLFLWVKD